MFACTKRLLTDNSMYKRVTSVFSSGHFEIDHSVLSTKGELEIMCRIFSISPINFSPSSPVLSLSPTSQCNFLPSPLAALTHKIKCFLKAANRCGSHNKAFSQGRQHNSFMTGSTWVATAGDKGGNNALMLAGPMGLHCACIITVRSCRQFAWY